MPLLLNSTEKTAIDTIRILAADAVQEANSGHPGAAISLAPLGYILFNEILNYDPADPAWLGRDRFVLSVGHVSMLLYSLLHLSGVKQLDADGKVTDELAVSLEAIKSFRQLGSRCAGHPEYSHLSGVEFTTGPLGQGVAGSVGMAISAKWLAARYNSAHAKLFDYNVYSLCGDGCIMEGVTAEAASLAGHLQLDNLCWIYDANDITIEGNVALAMTEDVGKRFEAYGWNVISVADANDLEAIRAALAGFQKNKKTPTLIIVKSVIAYGAPHLAGKCDAHGAPLGADEVKGVKRFYGFNENEKFTIPEGVPQIFAEGIGKRGAAARALWQQMFESYRTRHPQQATEIDLIASKKLPSGWNNISESFPADPKGIASRVASGKVLNKIAENLPWLLGGSADLGPSAKSELTFLGAGEFSAEFRSGRNFHFGVREHAMGQIVNGMVVSGLRGYCATFFVFVDYMRPAIRAAALMQLPSLFLFSHDSICVGEDGPTHQPIEQLASLRAMPNVAVFRPADANEVTECYKVAMQLSSTPSVIVTTRQNIPTIDRKKYAGVSDVARGGYIIAEAKDSSGAVTTPEIILIATGSEVHLCLEAYEKLTEQGKRVRVVSLPCWEIFENQGAEYRNLVLPPTIKKRLGVELGCDFGWSRFIGCDGIFLGINHFGSSAPPQVLMESFGFTTENIYKIAHEMFRD